jgi:DNA-binding NarL/FixJ family response regulator
MDKKINLIIVDDSPLHIIGLKTVLKCDERMGSVYQAGCPDEAMEQLKQHLDIDVAIIDICMRGDADGLDLAEKIRDDYPSVRTMILSQFKNGRYIYRALLAKSKAYLAKDSSPELVVDAICNVYNGNCIFFGDTIEKEILENMFGGEKNLEKIKPFSLSVREMEVLQYVTDGFSSKEIGVIMNITQSTVETNKDRIKNKLGLKTIAECVAFGIKHGITDFGG